MYSLESFLKGFFFLILGFINVFSRYMNLIEVLQDSE